MEAALEPIVVTILVILAIAWIAPVCMSFVWVGKGRRVIWTFVLIGFALAFFQFSAALGYVDPRWIPALILFNWVVILPLSGFVGRHQRDIGLSNRVQI